MRPAFHGLGPILRHAAQFPLRAFFSALALLLSAGTVPAAQTPAPAPAQKTTPPTPAKSSAKASGKASGKSLRSRSTRKSRSRERAQRAPTPERISEIQSALAKAGHYSGAPTGKWDPSTVQALKHYQQASGLPPTGKLDARTLQKLGLGSPITGIAAPHPPAAVPPAAPSPTTAPATPPSS